ncbi:MAG: DUF4126 domain-containing protein [Wenzhouxiangella sp.]|nr:MAG: DUF4126 domain-containing protein [Wenzhouxiangella sp.]
MEQLSDLTALSAIMAGITLSAAAGLRVFLPILALGISVRMGWLEVGEQFAWLASEPVLLIVGIAALLEAGAYYVPLVDNLLDILATPAAIGGGTVIVASLLPEMNGLAQWSSALALGGGSAGIVQGATVVTRGLSTASSGGLANPLVSTGETAGSLFAILMALLVPILFGILVIIALFAILVWLARFFRKQRNPPDPDTRPA